MNAIRQFLRSVCSKGVMRSEIVRTTAMGRERAFVAYDCGNDTFILEKGIWQHLHERPSVLVLPKGDLRNKAPGWIMTLTTGNHSVAAMPLLDGRFWALSNAPASSRSEILLHRILCANVVGATLELSQRDVSTERLVQADTWLRSGAGFALNDIVMSDRNEATLDYYRRLGQDWRVKPLAWTQNEMRVALAAARKRIASPLEYFHSARGVHLLSFGDFRRFVALAQTDVDAFLKGLNELVGIYEGSETSFTRMPKYRGHHEIEFFGLRRRVALERLIPEMERLLESIRLGQIGQLGVIQKAQEVAALYESLLSRREFADETSDAFVETVYMYVTGEIYALVGEGSTPAFDDRRTALPGATFVDGRLEMHPGADVRTEILLSNLRGVMSKDERVTYANVYELRTKNEHVRLGAGSTREVVYKTDKRPLENSLIEKRLSHSSAGYSAYMLARIGALRALGIGLSDRYLLLKQRPGQTASRNDYYIRSRCEGEPLDAISASYFKDAGDSDTENSAFVLDLAAMMGDAAAQNLVMKKFDPKTQSPLYGVGKEIYDFEYDILRERIVPKKVSTCSIRGSFGWPDLSYTDENLERMGQFYLTCYARTLIDYQRHHAGVRLEALADRFMNGFEFRTHALEWQLSVMRDQFETFSPEMPARYGFKARWRFAMWALERQDRRLPALRKRFFEKLEELKDEGLRNNPQ